MPLRRTSANHPDMGFQIAPMIDVVFVIMLFFMVMAGDVKKEISLATKLPGPPDPTPTPVDIDTLQVAVSETGSLSLNGDPMTKPELVSRLGLLAQNARNSGTKLLVTLTPEKTAAYEHLAVALDALASAGALETTTFALTDAGE